MEVSIEGSIGSGKSSLIDGLKRVFACAVEPEPVDQWAPLLEKFYRDPKRWGFTLQTQILTSFMSRPKCTGLKVIERSPASCRYVFGELLHEEGNLDEIEWNVFQELYDRSREQLQVPKICIWVDAPAEVCFDRACKRGRNAETSLTLEYLCKLEAKYSQFASGNHFDQVHRIDGRLSAHEVLDSAVAYLASEFRKS